MDMLIVGFGFGFLAGAIVFDQLWRHVRRLEKRLASLSLYSLGDD